MLFFSEGKGTICKPYPPKHMSHRLFHGIPCNRYSIQISWRNSWNFSILEIILENPPKFLKTPLNFGRGGNAGLHFLEDGPEISDPVGLDDDWVQDLAVLVELGHVVSDVVADWVLCLLLPPPSPSSSSCPWQWLAHLQWKDDKNKTLKVIWSFGKGSEIFWENSHLFDFHLIAYYMYVCIYTWKLFTWNVLSITISRIWSLNRIIIFVFATRHLLYS